MSVEPGEQTTYRRTHNGLGSSALGAGAVAHAAAPPSIAPFGKVIGAEGAPVRVAPGFASLGATNYRAPGFLLPAHGGPEEREAYLKLARNVAEVAEAGSKKKNASNVPLGERGLQVTNRYQSEYQDMVDYGNDVTVRARSERLDVKKIFTGPTAQPTPVVGDVAWLEATLAANAAARKPTSARR